MATTGLGVVSSPPAIPPAVGLIPALSGPYLDPSGETDQQWVDGVRYNPEQLCTTPSVSDPCSSTTNTIPENPTLVDFVPFRVETGDKCSPFTFQSRDFRGRATRALLAGESKAIAKEFWTGTQAKASGWANDYLAKDATADTLTGVGSPATVATALELLEFGIGYFGTGAPGAIHCTRELGAAFSALANTLIKANGRIETYMGTTIIPDAGYDGSGPQGQPAINGSQWAYATLMPTVRRSEIQVSPDNMSEATITTTNLIEWRAWRIAAVTISPCVHVAVEVNLPLPLVGGAS